MKDVSFYNRKTGAKEYEKMVEYLDYYVLARKKLIETAQKYLPENGGILADFCCGSGKYSRDISKGVKDGLQKTVLIDISKYFLNEARTMDIKSKELEIIQGDITKVKLPEKICDVVIAAFAYHHVPDEDKSKFIEQAKSTLKMGGVFILAEIFTKDDIAYYTKVIKHAKEQYGEISGIDEFLGEISRSTNTEFKVAKSFTDTQLRDGFEKVEEYKIWPNDEELGKDVGTYVIVSKSI